MRVLTGKLLGVAFLLFCAGSVWAKTEVLSENSKQLRVVIREDMAQIELKADSLRRAGQYDAAIEGYQRLIDESQTEQSFGPGARLSLRVYYTKKIAACYRSKGDYNRALEQYRTILALAQENSSEEMATSALLGMGKLALAFSRCDGVAEVFENRKHNLPDELLVLLGDIYQKAGRTREARQTYLDVLESHLGPRQQGRIILGCYGVPPEERELLEQEALERAENLVSGLENLAGEGDSQAQLLLGQLAWEQGTYNKALAEFQKAERLAPQDPLIGLQIVRTFIALGNQQRALEKLAVIRSSLTSPGELLELATAFQLAGDSKSAAEALRRLAAEYPDNPEAREAYLRLQLMKKIRTVAP